MEEWWNLEPNLEMAKASRVAYDKSGINGVYKYIINYDLEKKFAHNQAYRMAQKYAFIKENEKALEMVKVRPVARRPIRAARASRSFAILK